MAKLLSLTDTLPDTRVLTVADFRIGICHGHQISPWGDPLALAALARKLDVDVLVTGHTHVNDIVEYEGRCFVNPGSITGAYSPQAGSKQISMCAIEGLVPELYRLFRLSGRTYIP